MSKKTQVTNTLKVNRDLNEKINTLEKVNRDLNTQIARVNALEHDLHTRNNTIATLHAEIQVHEQHSQHQQAQIAQQNHTIATLNAEIQVREQHSQHQQAQIAQMIAQRIERQVIIDTLKELRLMSEFESMHTAVNNTLKELRLMSEFESMHTAVSHGTNTLTDYTTMLKDKWSRGIRKLFNEKTQFVTTAVVGSEISIPVAHRINYDIQEEAPNRQIDTAVYRVLNQGFILGDTVIEKARVTRIDPL